MNNKAPIIRHTKNLPPTKIGNKEHYFAQVIGIHKTQYMEVIFVVHT